MRDGTKHYVMIPGCDHLSSRMICCVVAILPLTTAMPITGNHPITALSLSYYTFISLQEPRQAASEIGIDSRCLPPKDASPRYFAAIINKIRINKIHGQVRSQGRSTEFFSRRMFAFSSGRQPGRLIPSYRFHAYVETYARGRTHVGRTLTDRFLHLTETHYSEKSERTLWLSSRSHGSRIP